MHVNLILDDEIRSTSPVSMGLLLKLAGIVVLVLTAVWGFAFIAAYRGLQSESRYMAEEWTRTESKYKEATQLRADLGGKEATLNEIEGWRASRVSWGQQLGMLQTVIPPVIQLMELHMAEFVPAATTAVSTGRVFELRLSGRTPADRSEANVVQLLDALKGSPFDRYIESSTLPSGSFRQDPLDKASRQFNIVSRYLPRPLP